MADSGARRPWTKPEAMLAYRLYCELPFGRLHRTNPAIVELARFLDRTASAVALKLSNFAHLDPSLTKRGIRGMSNVSALDREIVREFGHDWNQALEDTSETPASVESALSDYFGEDRDPKAETESVATRKVRLTQRFFRRAVLASYRLSCCMCGISTRELLRASHIVPWSVDVAARSDPRNGLALCAIHDRAFDAGLLTVTPRHLIQVSRVVDGDDAIPLSHEAFAAIAGSPIRLPSRFLPNAAFLRRHNLEVFRP